MTEGKTPFIFDVFSDFVRGDQVVSVARVCRSWVLLIRNKWEPLSRAEVAGTEAKDDFGNLFDVPLKYPTRETAERSALDWMRGLIKLSK